ncbi:MAG: ATP-dependent zinc metalloprotease FtsH [Lachnospiraceae bacterium]|nr:ATP-dependent zinc metalloprotease FtsH [Lachnospiraceae bacterium]
MKHSFRGLGFYLFILVILFLLWRGFGTNGSLTTTETYTWSQFQEVVEDGGVTSLVITQNQEVPTGVVTVTLEDGTRAQVTVSDVGEVETYLEEEGFTDYTLKDVQGTSVLASVLPTVIVLIALVFMMVMMTGQAGGGGGGNSRMMNFGKSRARLTSGENVKVKFKDVAGLREEKEELEGMVDFLKAPGKYTKLGARIPKGVLLVGPPGTGKTLIAKAVAGEAGVPFFSISGSDFVEMFVGVGASRVRDMFAEAKKQAPCIVFIDEIDAVGRRRGTGMGGGHDEREQTLNQLLVEMDGFGVNEGIIVVAATNRVDILDPALLRPGRFDRKVYVGKPDVAGREQILEVHVQNKPLGDDVDLKQIAQTTAGFTGADLENLLNEAAIIAAKDKRAFICQEDIRKAFIKVGIGAEKKSRVITDKEKRITAFHESGHAILFHVLPDVGPVYTVSIIPTGIGAAGYTMPLPEKDEMFRTKGQMLQEIMVDLGGRIAEEMVFGDVTTGASQDIKQATSVARAMVTKYGMSEALGLINYDNDDDEVFIGRDLAHTKSYSDDVATRIDAEVKRIVDECYQKAKEIIEAHEDVLHRSAELLLEKEKIGRDEFEKLFD